MAKLSLTPIGSRYGSIDALNANFDAIEAAIENTLSLDNTAPNSLNDDLDLDSNRIINLGNAVNNSDAVTLQQVNNIIDAASSGLIVSLKQFITATAGQTVFNLTSFTYFPGGNNLSVYVNGVRQYVGLSYIETNSSRITFVSGLTVGAVVEFVSNEAVSSTISVSSGVQYQPAGTGAVATTVQAKLRESVSVLDFGAVANGVIATGAGTNNSPMFQAAITALGAGGVLYVPAGNYVLTTQVTVPSDFTITGAGSYQTFLIAPTAFNSDGLLKLNGAGGPPTTISNLCIGGQTGGAGASSIGINSLANGVFLQNLWLTAFKTNVVLGSTDNFLLDSVIETTVTGGTGINITSTNVTVANCVTYACYVGLDVSNAAYIDGTITLSNIRSLACTYTGFTFTSSSNIQMSNCSAGHNNTTRYGFAAVSIDTCTNVNISNFIGRLGAVSSAAWGIYATGSSKINIVNSQLSNWLYGVYVIGGSEVVVNGNTCSNNYSRGIYSIGTDRLIISNNCCVADGNVGVSDAGIYSDNTSGYAIHNITGNVCTQAGGGTQEYGIYATIFNNGAASGFTNIVGNICKYNATANISKNGVTANIGDTGNLS